MRSSLRCPKCGHTKISPSADSVVPTGTAVFHISASSLGTCESCMHLDHLSKFVPDVYLYVAEHMHKDYGDGPVSSYMFRSHSPEHKLLRSLSEGDIAEMLDIDYEPEDGEELIITCKGTLEDIQEIQES